MQMSIGKVIECWVPCDIIPAVGSAAKPTAEAVTPPPILSTAAAVSPPPAAETVPANAAASASVAAPQAPAPAPAVSDSKAISVLIVEDTVPVQKLLSRWFSTRGCSVKCAENGKIGHTSCIDIGSFLIRFAQDLIIYRLKSLTSCFLTF